MQDQRLDRYSAVRQYTLAQILGVWTAAALPMAVLAWVVAPWLSDQLGGSEPLARSLLILLTGGLVWQFLLVALLIWREIGTLRWARVRDALWLNSPRDPRNGRVGGRVWLWILPFVILLALWQAVPSIEGPLPRDFAAFLESSRGEEFFEGAWGWYAMVLALTIFNTVLGEELLFRGLLLPRMRGAFGRWDWVANGVLFAIYHLHLLWVIPFALADTFLYAFPARRYTSAWFGIILHSVQSIVIAIAVLVVVLG